MSSLCYRRRKSFYFHALHCAEGNGIEITYNIIFKNERYVINLTLIYYMKFFCATLTCLTYGILI